MRFRMVRVDAVSVDAGIWSQRVFMAELVAPRLFPEKLVNLPSGTQKRIKSPQDCRSLRQTDVVLTQLFAARFSDQIIVFKSHAALTCDVAAGF